MKDGNVHLVQESQEHTKSVTSLAILQSVDRLYSGSLDRSVRVMKLDHTVVHYLVIERKLSFLKLLALSLVDVVH